MRILSATKLPIIFFQELTENHGHCRHNVTCLITAKDENNNIFFIPSVFNFRVILTAGKS